MKKEDYLIHSNNKYFIFKKDILNNLFCLNMTQFKWIFYILFNSNNPSSIYYRFKSFYNKLNNNNNNSWISIYIYFLLLLFLFSYLQSVKKY